jgi:DNA helicase II / ATP-dependent DNA helicase PcrA
MTISKNVAEKETLINDFLEPSIDEEHQTSPSLTSEQLNTIKVEEQVLNDVVNSINNQIQNSAKKLFDENSRARELTSALVETRRAEDKAMLASDEAVSHALKDRKREEVNELERTLNRPYFARIVLEEENNKLPSPKRLEYKIGFTTNLDCRIIDWRKAPLSKIYYEYGEGDEYFEEIQGRERVGKVLTRNRLDIENSSVVRIITGKEELVKDGINWQISYSRRSLGRKGEGAYNKLPDVLSLITKDQFKAITTEAKSAVFIQGIAGSGKTTVALHRLAWLLGPDNSNVTPSNSAILVLSPALKTYIRNTLPSLQAESIKVLGFSEWLNLALTGSSLPLPNISTDISQTSNRVKQSEGFLKAFQYILTNKKGVVEPSTVGGKIDKLISIYNTLLPLALSNQQIIFENDPTRLIDAECLKIAKEKSQKNVANSTIDEADLPLLLLLKLELESKCFLPSGYQGIYEHLVVDEVQDLSATQLVSVVKAVKNPSGLTMVGDTSQIINLGSTFPGWDKLMDYCRLDNSDNNSSKYLKLDVSFRSTLPIMKLASYLNDSVKVTEGRSGRVPIWFECYSEDNAVEATIAWINRAQERYPNSVTAVLCRSFLDAKFIYSLLTPTFGDTISLAQKGSLNLVEGIVVSDIEQIKGLEFTNVLLWNVNEDRYRHSNQNDKNLLYVGITRAEENLCLISTNKHTRLLPPKSSSLIRYIKEEPALEQEEN